MLLTITSNCENLIIVLIWYYILFNLLNYYFMYLDYKNLKFKYLINDIDINIWSFQNFENMKHISFTINLSQSMTKNLT